MVKPNEEEIKIIERVEEAVCRYFGVDEDKIASKQKTLNVAMARAFIFYILHIDYKLSINKIANTYFRTARLVNWQCEKVRYMLKQRNYAKTYSDILEAINE